MRLFWLEVILAMIAPIVLLSFRKLRNSPGGLYLIAVMVVLGFITNRLNVSITGMEGTAGGHYLPKWTEFAITAMIVAAGFALFGLAAKYLPIFPNEKEHDAAAEEPKAVPVTAAVMTNAGD